MSSDSPLKRLFARPEAGPAILLVLLIVVFTSINPAFLSVLNISNTLAFTVELGLIALGMTLLMTAGEFDLSVGSLFGLTPVLMWALFNSGATSLLVAFLVAMAIAAVIGVINGWFVTALKIPSFLVTLGMLLVARGTALYITDGFPQRTWSADGEWVASVLVGSIEIGPLRLYMSLFWFILVAVVLHYVLTKSRRGNWIQASGGNPGAAMARGVNVARTKVGLFILSAMLAGFAGIISSIRTSAANPNSGTGYELEVIAMVVIGGTALTGGRGTIIGTVLGIFIPRLMRNGIIMVGVPGLAYNIFIGAIILGMMALHSWLDRRHQSGADMAEELIRMVNISKFYGQVRALENVNLTVNRGEVVGLLGDNGAGKSTLIKVLSGAVPASSGEIFVKGKKVEMRGTPDAIANGIETIYQDSALVTQLSIARNLFLGREPVKGPRFMNRMDMEKMEQVAANLLREVGITKNIPASTPIGALSGGERQAVAIARAMHFDSDLIILDEPTNNLGVAETQGVLQFVRNARDSGHSCIFIAHNIHHVFQVVDRIVVMRRGTVVADAIDPRKSTVAEVESVITGMDHIV